MDPTPTTPTARLLGFLTVALAVGVLLRLLAGMWVPWSLLTVPLVWLAVLLAGVEALAPRPWLHRAKWGALAAAVALGAVAFVYATFVAGPGAPPPDPGVFVPSGR